MRLLLILLLFSPLANAAYKCQTEKGVVYQDKPCATGKQTEFDARSDRARQWAAADREKTKYDTEQTALYAALRGISVGDNLGETMAKVNPDWQRIVQRHTSMQFSRGITERFLFWDDTAITTTNGIVQFIHH